VVVLVIIGEGILVVIVCVLTVTSSGLWISLRLGTFDMLDEYICIAYLEYIIESADCF
jgi:hypothetical protein